MENVAARHPEFGFDIERRHDLDARLASSIEGEAGLGYVLKPGFMLPPLMFTDEEIDEALERAMAAGSNVTIEIDSKSLPILPGVLDIASENKSGGMKTNRDHFESGIDYCSEIPDSVRDLLFDPQTSGGLLLAGLAADRRGEGIALLRSRGGASAAGRAGVPQRS